MCITSSRIIDGLAYEAAVEPFGKTKEPREPSPQYWRRRRPAVRTAVLRRDGDDASSSHTPAIRDLGAKLSDKSRVSRTGDLGVLVGVADVCSVLSLFKVQSS